MVGVLIATLLLLSAFRPRRCRRDEPLCLASDIHLGPVDHQKHIYPPSVVLKTPQPTLQKHVRFGSSVIFDVDSCEYFTDEDAFRRRMQEIRRALRMEEERAHYMKQVFYLGVVFVIGCSLFKIVA